MIFSKHKDTLGSSTEDVKAERVYFSQRAMPNVIGNPLWYCKDWATWIGFLCTRTQTGDSSKGRNKGKVRHRRGSFMTQGRWLSSSRSNSLAFLRNLSLTWLGIFVTSKSAIRCQTALAASSTLSFNFLMSCLSQSSLGASMSGLSLKHSGGT